MKTVVITDAMYRSSVAAARLLGRSGYRVVLTQTRAECSLTPPSFDSRYAAETRWIPGSVADDDYPDKLFAILSAYSRPVLLCIDADTLNTVSWQRERFRTVCDFYIAAPGILDALNDKDTVYRRCQELHIAVPRRYEGIPQRYPVVVKPRCGERFGLKAKDRYIIADNLKEYRRAVSVMSKYDAAPLVQEKLTGAAIGVNLLMGRDGTVLDVFCHRRVREYPVTGGPSSCCESIYSLDMIRPAQRLLRSFHFTGLAMVEFKGGCVLEVNPRIWGSFPLAEKCDSRILEHYVSAAQGKDDVSMDFFSPGFQTGVKMRFLLNDSAAMWELLRHGKFSAFGEGIRDMFTAKEALYARDDPAPMRRYLRNTLLHR